MRKLKPNKAFRNHPLVSESRKSRRNKFAFEVERKKNIKKAVKYDTKKRFANSYIPKEVYLVKKVKFTLKEILISIGISFIIDFLIVKFTSLIYYFFSINHFFILIISYLFSTTIYRLYISIKYNKKRSSLLYSTILVLSEKGITIKNIFLSWENIESTKINTKIAKSISVNYFLEIKTKKEEIVNINLQDLIFNKFELEYLLTLYKNKYEKISIKTDPIFEKRYMDFKYSKKKHYILSNFVSDSDTYF